MTKVFRFKYNNLLTQSLNYCYILLKKKNGYKFCLHLTACLFKIKLSELTKNIYLDLQVSLKKLILFY